MDGGGESLSIVDGWQETPEARSYINQLLIRNKRILFGRSNCVALPFCFNPCKCGINLPGWYPCTHTPEGILERPALEQLGSGSTFKKRLFLVGKSGVGKSSTVAKLCGRGGGRGGWCASKIAKIEHQYLMVDISSSHDETLGIQTTTIYWPAKVWLLSCACV